MRWPIVTPEVIAVARPLEPRDLRPSVLNAPSRCDRASLRGDLLEYGKAIVAGATTREVEPVVRAVASIGDRSSALAETSRRFWDARLELAGQIVERAVSRGEASPDTDPRHVLEAIVAPIYFRLLMSGEEIDDSFVEGLAEMIAAGAALNSTR